MSTQTLIQPKKRKSHPYTWKSDVPNRRLRRAYLESEMTSQEVAIKLGWVRRQFSHGYFEIVPDTTRVLRALGLAQYAQSANGNRPGGKRVRHTISHKIAKELCDVFGVLPTEVGF